MKTTATYNAVSKEIYPCLMESRTTGNIYLMQSCTRSILVHRKDGITPVGYEVVWSCTNFLKPFYGTVTIQSDGD